MNTIRYEVVYESSDKEGSKKILHELCLSPQDERVKISNLKYELCLNKIPNKNTPKNVFTESTYSPIKVFKYLIAGRLLCLSTENVDFGDIETKLRKLANIYADKSTATNLSVLELLYILRELPTMNDKTRNTKNNLIENGTDIKDLSLYGWKTNYTEENLKRHLDNLKNYFEEKNKREYLLTQDSQVCELIQDCIKEVNRLCEELKNVG